MTNTIPIKPQDHTVVILGATHKPDRYANKAQRELMMRGYRVIPVHPKLKEIEGISVVNNLSDINEPVHTLTLYVGTARSSELIDAIIQLNPQRVIFNPGTESALLETRLPQQGIDAIQGCTLVMLRTNQF